MVVYQLSNVFQNIKCFFRSVFRSINFNEDVVAFKVFFRVFIFCAFFLSSSFKLDGLVSRGPFDLGGRYLGAVSKYLQSLRMPDTDTAAKLESNLNLIRSRCLHEIRNKAISLGSFNYVHKVVVNEDSKVVVIGDIHGYCGDLNLIFSMLEERGIINDGVLAPNCYIIFLGDYIDRGPKNIEVLTLIINLKINNPLNVFEIKGNHEDVLLSSQDLAQELYQRSRSERFARKRYYSLKGYLFKLFPSAIFLNYGEGQDAWIHLSHGGLDLYSNVYLDDDGIRKSEVCHGFDSVTFLKSDFDIELIDEQSFRRFAWNEVVSFFHEFDFADSSRGSGQGLFDMSSNIASISLKQGHFAGMITGHTHTDPIVSHVSSYEELDGLSFEEYVSIGKGIHDGLYLEENIPGFCNMIPHSDDMFMLKHIAVPLPCYKLSYVPSFILLKPNPESSFKWDWEVVECS